MFKKYQLKYITYGRGIEGPKIYGVMMIKSDRGWIVQVWPCDVYGSQVSDAIAWQDELDWWTAKKLFHKYYKEYNQYVNNRI